MADVAFNVSQINDYISRKIYTDLFLKNLTVIGEVTNFSMSSIGHAFFSLKDEGSMIDCIIYDYYSSEQTEAVKDGELILARGNLTYYKRTGTLQLAVKSAKPQGIGDLYAKFEKTKAKLLEEGVFDQTYKKPIPQFPAHIGVVTSAAGAAVHDIINVATRRFEGVRITVYPAKVQGEGAANEVAAGIEYFNTYSDADVIIVGRGGGSFEDLFAFNDEIVARAVFESSIPIVSAVGHETDFSLCDLAADLRAPTPSAAAELVVKDKAAVLQYIEDYKSKLLDMLAKSVKDRDNRLKLYESSLKSYPLGIKVSRAEEKIASLTDIMNLNLKTQIEKKELILDKLESSLYDLNPREILKRGYAIVYDKNQNVVTSSKGSQKEMEIELSDGRISVQRKA